MKFLVTIVILLATACLLASPALGTLTTLMVSQVSRSYQALGSLYLPLLSNTTHSSAPVLCLSWPFPLSICLSPYSFYSLAQKKPLDPLSGLLSPVRFSRRNLPAPSGSRSSPVAHDPSCSKGGLYRPPAAHHNGSECLLPLGVPSRLRCCLLPQSVSPRPELRVPAGSFPLRFFFLTIPSLARWVISIAGDVF